MGRRVPLITFYGDDFTGSTDLVLQYRRFGLPGIIFMGLPSLDQLQAAAQTYSVVGIAGVTRSMAPADIEVRLEPALHRLAELGPDLIQYKVCSTADSSPTVGSFAPAIRLGRLIAGGTPVPVLVAQPSLGRYTVFSNHFAVDRGQVYRLDRQPVMSQHPVTPMTEADLRTHLEQQLLSTVGAVTVNDLRADDGGRARWADAVGQDLSAVVLDSLTEEDLRLAGELVLAQRHTEPVFVVGSGGFSTGIAAALGFSRVDETDAPVPARGPCLAVSGSCSPVTSDQIRYAREHGWAGVHLDLAEPDTAGCVERAVTQARAHLEADRSVVVYTYDGQHARVPMPVETVGSALAEVVRGCARGGALSRVLVAGGDTSGHVMTSLKATALHSRATLGATLLCGLESADPVVNGLEVVLKGGQIGTVDYFEHVRQGDGAASSSM